MDIYRFFNSKDVSDHLREVGRELSAFEAAYVVDHCDGATLEEKISAWREIVDTMPDCPTAWNHNVARRESTHALLREYVDLQRRMLGMFEGARAASTSPGGCGTGSGPTGWRATAARATGSRTCPSPSRRSRAASGT